MEHSRLFIFLLLLVAYLVAVKASRFRRREAIKRKHAMLNQANFAHLTADQAQDVLQELVEMEFPKLMGFSIVFALFKTYGIPSVSSLLISTGELANSETASKRTADTGVLLLEFCLNKPSSTRSAEAIARMNYLHSHYIKAGKISNDDMLYTLSLFALEPVRWINSFEWRKLSDFEQCASGTFWKAIGDRMEISFSPLPSFTDGWNDGLHWLDEVREWSEQYERAQMLPAKTNQKLALAHLDVIFLNLPERARILGQYLVSALVGERVQKAMMLPVPPWYFQSAIEFFVVFRKLILRHLVLPRPEFMRKQYIPSTPEANGRYSAREYLSHPWYVKPTFKRRWGLKALVTRLLGRKLPGDDGNKYSPEGYRIAEVGPKRLSKSGHREMEADLSRMRHERPGGCPFAIRKK